MEHLIVFLQIMLINIVLSGDNAVVIAMASKNLPPHQRRLAVWWGAAGAVVLRIVLALVAIALLNVPYLRAIGAMLLMYIAIKLLTEDKQHGSIKEAVSVSSAIWTIIFADLVMSLDNVLAIAAITRDNFVLLCIGVALSLPLIVWGSQMIIHMLRRYPILIILGAAILGFAAGEMFVTEPVIHKWLLHAHPSYHWAVPLFCTSFLLVFGVWRRLTAR
jgi:YjbE family integral membrane protein